MLETTMARAHQRPRTAKNSAAVTERPFPFAARGTSRSTIEQTIFDATEDLLQSTSLEDLTVAHILERADISRTTFYRYFTSKHQVVSAMLEAVQQELVDVMQPWFTRGDRAPDAALSDALGSVADVWGRHRPVLRACSEHWHSDPEIGERWVAMMDRFTSDISRQIDRERKAGEAPKGVDSRKLALHLAWSCERLFYLAGFGLAGDNREQDAVDVLVAAWVGALYHR